jgi:SAM-dependent methyltransferase
MIRATQEQQRAHYAKHNNDISDPGYREHLLRLLTPLLPLLPDGALGLDYGCGPTTSMEVLMKERQIQCHSFDPFFFPQTTLLRERAYDFITCSEVVEHFHEPHKELPRILALLKPGATLAIMTQFPPRAFEEWWYHRDPTHVVFYSLSTFEWIARRWSLDTVVTATNMVIFTSP